MHPDLLGYAPSRIICYFYALKTRKMNVSAYSQRHLHLTAKARYAAMTAAVILSFVCQAAVLTPLNDAQSKTGMPADLLRYHTELDAKALEVLRASSQMEGREEIVDIQTLADRVLLLARSGLDPQALRVAQQFVGLSPNNAEARRLLGHVLFTGGQYLRALRELQRATRMDPQDAGAWLLLGATLVELDRTQEALTVFHTAQGHLPDRADFHHNAGVLLLRLERYEQAVEELARACALQPESAASQHDLGLALWALSRNDEALNALQAACLLAPGNEAYRHTLTIAYIEQGIREEEASRLLSAEEAYRRALHLAEGEPEIMLRLAWVLIAQGVDVKSLAEALALSEKAHEQLPEPSPRSLQILSAAQALNGHFPEATRTALRGATLAEIQGNLPLAQTLYTDWQLYSHATEPQD